MLPKEVKQLLTNNPNAAIYIRYGGWLQIHRPSSRTEVVRNAKPFHSVRVQTYNEERPDLAGKVANGGQMIITFDASVKREESNVASLNSVG